MTLENRMIQYLKVQGCADSTILSYRNILRLILRLHPDFENYNSQKLIEIMNAIPDPITRSNYRNVILNDRIAILTNLINQLEQKDSATISGYQNQLDLLHQEQALYKDQLNTYEKLLKRERRKRRLATAGGIVTTGLAIYLGFVK